ncbi:hypothetical protein N9Y42_02945 [Mariniblastus sp.]|nr:hypothetical protein [Mariniblastus sp.]
MKIFNKTAHHGMASVEAILVIATGALILLGLTQVTTSQLLPAVKEKVSLLLNSGSAFDGSNSPSVTKSDSETTNNESNSDDPSDSKNTGTGNSQLPESNPVAPPSELGGITPIGEDAVRDFIAESIKGNAKELADLAVDKAREELENYVKPSLPMGVDLELEDWDLKKAELNKSLVMNFGIALDAINAVDGLTQAEREIKELANEGKYEEAFGKIFSGSSRFITDAILSSEAVDTILDKLPQSAQAAIKSAIPNAIESASQAFGEKVFDSVGKKINDKLWDWYDKGYVPRKPRIPRDYNFEKNG